MREYERYTEREPNHYLSELLILVRHFLQLKQQCKIQPTRLTLKSQLRNGLNGQPMAGFITKDFQRKKKYPFVGRTRSKSEA